MPDALTYAAVTIAQGQETFTDGRLDGTAFVTGTWAVENGELHARAGSGRVADYLITPLGAADYTASARVRLTSGYAGAGVIFRFVDHIHFYYVTLDTAAVGVTPPRSLALYKISSSNTEADSLLSGKWPTGENWYLLGGTTLPAALNEPYDLSIRSVGNTFNVFVNGTPSMTVVDYDDAYTARNGVGLISFQTEAFFDDWRVEQVKRTK